MNRKNTKSSKPQLQTHYHVKDGAHFREIDPSKMDLSGNDTCFVYEITKEEVEACDTKRLLHDLRPEVGNPLLASGPGSVIFSVSGYDEDPRDLWRIAEFRAFVRKVQESSPCWLYFAMPLGGWLNIIALASTDESQEVRMNGNLQVLTIAQIAEFIRPQLKEYSRLMEQRGIGRDDNDSHLCASMQVSFPGLLSSPTND
jgi:hypothetical protein